MTLVTSEKVAVVFACLLLSSIRPLTSTAERIAPVADPLPPKLVSKVTVVPVAVRTFTPAARVTDPAPLVIETTSPVARLVALLTLVTVAAPEAISPATK